LGELKGAEAESFRPFVSPLLCGVGYFRGPVSSVEICSAGIKLLAQLVGAWRGVAVGGFHYRNVLSLCQWMSDEINCRRAGKSRPSDCRKVLFE